MREEECILHSRLSAKKTLIKLARRIVLNEHVCLLHSKCHRQLWVYTDRLSKPYPPISDAFVSTEYFLALLLYK